MPALDTQAPPFSLRRLDGTAWNLTDEIADRPAVLFFFETDCPSCRLSVPNLKRLAHWLDDSAAVVGISQDPADATREIVSRLDIDFPVLLDADLSVSRLYDPLAVPTLFLVDGAGRIVRHHTGFEKAAFNDWAAALAALLAGGLLRLRTLTTVRRTASPVVCHAIARRGRRTSRPRRLIFTRSRDRRHRVSR